MGEGRRGRSGGNRRLLHLQCHDAEHRALPAQGRRQHPAFSAIAIRRGGMVQLDAVFSKCAWRLIPFITLLYVVGFIDRSNVGFAALTMNRDLGFSPQIFGLGAGIFFLGFITFQIPTAVLLARLGARRVIFCVMLVWGLVSAANAFMQGPSSFYLLRFSLGVAEGGFTPSMIYYLTLWFPPAYRGRFIATFCSAIPIAGIISGPL